MRNCLICFIVFIVIAGCCPKLVNLDVTNPDEQSMIVNVKVDDGGKLYSNEIIKVPAAKKVDGDSVSPANLTKQFKVPASSSLSISYTPGTSNVKMNGPTFTAPDCSGADEVTFAVFTAKVERIDDTNAINTFQTLASDLKWGSKTEMLRLADYKKYLGAIIIKNKDGIIDSIPLAKVDINHDAATDLKRTINISGRSYLNNKLNIPVYGSLASEMSTSGVYQVKWHLSHHPYENSYTPTAMIMNAKKEDLRKLYYALNWAPNDAKAYYLGSMHVLESGAFNVTKGREIKVTADVAVASVFSADGGYVFNSSDTSILSTGSRVWNVEFREFPGSAKLKKLIKSDGTLKTKTEMLSEEERESEIKKLDKLLGGGETAPSTETEALIESITEINEK